MHKLECKDGYKEFLVDIKEYFDKTDNLIHQARNKIKIIDYQDKSYIVKSFKVPNILNKIIYTFFKDTKAKKSYKNTIYLKEFAPVAIGYIEFYKDNLLQESFFVSEKFDYDFTIREPLLDKNFEDRDKIFKEFARFTFWLHENGILHKDYSPGNILIKKDDKDGYIFKIVDVNRMEFRELIKEERLKNFDKLWADDKDLKIIVKEYANLSGFDEKESVQRAIYYSKKLKDFKNLKKRLKKAFK